MVQDTKEKLKKTFIELCAEKGAASVTVSAVTKRSGCNRCTFYNYYEGIEDLLEEIENEIFAKIERHFENLLARGIPQNFEDAFPDISG